MSPFNLTRTRNLNIAVSLAAYSANDVLGVGGYIEVDFGVPGLKLLGLHLFDAIDQKPTFTVYVYDRKPAVVAADNAAWAADANTHNHLRGRFTVASGDWTSENSMATASVNLEALGISVGDLSNNKLYLVFKVTNTPDYAAATDLTIHLTVLVDG